jgi:uncharacterized protein YcnI
MRNFNQIIKISNKSLKVLFLILSLCTLHFALLTNISAHVVVKPNQVGVGERTNFVVTVPTEEDIPTTQVRLVIPDGVQSVRPNVKSGWKIELKKSGKDEEVKVTEIIWSGGNIPAEQRDEFVFSAQAPAQEGNVVWKAYQTYGDGTVVAWDIDPKAVEDYSKNNNTADTEDDHDAPRPYSQTKVVNDLAASNTISATNQELIVENKKTRRAVLFSAIAIVLAGASLWLQLSKRQK